ncbi:MAG: hypothetical protein IT558_03035 [Alphaproteobacteria bacterium]|nr:hypothetical protein [Alphaproteobacteria bacterium]
MSNSLDENYSLLSQLHVEFEGDHSIEWRREEDTAYGTFSSYGHANEFVKYLGLWKTIFLADAGQKEAGSIKDEFQGTGSSYGQIRMPSMPLLRAEKVTVEIPLNIFNTQELRNVLGRNMDATAELRAKTRKNPNEHTYLM